MSGSQPEEHVRWPVVKQTWRHVCFVHWRIAVECVRRLLPPGLVPEILHGSAWVSIVAFSVEDFRVIGVPPRPGRGAFPETNVRTYVQRPSGRDGIWFFSLDVPSLLNVAGGRAIGVPYRVASMRLDDTDRLIRYRSVRRFGRPAGHDLAVAPGPLVTGPELRLAESLAGRWRAYSNVGRLLEVPVEHEPWSLHQARLVRLDQNLLEAAGLAPEDSDPIVNYADRVHARLGRPRLTASSL
jgi:uncharacterized protein YqjF (DUF2071 family)